MSNIPRYHVDIWQAYNLAIWANKTLDAIAITNKAQHITHKSLHIDKKSNLDTNQVIKEISCKART